MTRLSRSVGEDCDIQRERHQWPIACFDRFPEAAIRESGYRSLWAGQKSWNGVAILARGTEPLETQRGLPGDPEDTQSRYLEAAVNGVLVACLYLPNQNPVPGPKFDYKLRWFESAKRASRGAGRLQ